MLTTVDNKNDNATEIRILKVAEHEFMTKGFAGARTTTIAERAGVTHAMFHYYFRTKEKLYDRIISEKVNILKEALLKSVEIKPDSLEEMIRNIIDCHLDFVASNPDLPRFIIGELCDNSDCASIFISKIKEYVPVLLNDLQAMIDETADKGLCRRVDAKMLMLDIVSLNVFPYLAAPLVNAVLDDCVGEHSEFAEVRKKENFYTIMRKLNMDN